MARSGPAVKDYQGRLRGFEVPHDLAPRFAGLRNSWNIKISSTFGYSENNHCRNQVFEIFSRVLEGLGREHLMEGASKSIICVDV